MSGDSAETALRLLAISTKKSEKAQKSRDDADALDAESKDLRLAAWALDPSLDPRPAIAAEHAATLERVERVSARSRELRAQGMDRMSAEAQAMLDCS